MENTVLDNKLRDFAETFLKPGEKDVKHAGKTIDKIAKALKNNRQFKYAVDRVIPAGSYGKSTALIQHFDVDLVAFVNGEDPPFQKILKDIEEALDMAEGMNVTDVFRTSHSVQFKLDGLEFDLLPAKNYVEGRKFDADEQVKTQRNLALAAIETKYGKTQKYDSSFSSALTESQVEFMAKQSAFIHTLIRLCKFWVKTLQLDYISGKSLIIELIATQVGQKMENNGRKPSMTSAFLEFLDLVIKFDSIDINFKPDGRTPSYLKQKPIIMDPTNPYNNIAFGMDSKMIRKLKEYAKETRRRLEQLMGSRILAEYVPLEMVFDPQPKVSRPPGSVPTPLVDIGGGVSYSHPKMIVQKNCKFSREEMEVMKLTINQSVVTKLQALTAAGKPGTSYSDVQKVVTDMVDRNVRGSETMGWGRVTSSEKHEDYDLTFVIPFVHSDGCPLTVWVSFKK